MVTCAHTLAMQGMAEQDEMVLEDEIIEADGAAHGKMKKTGHVEHKSRKKPPKSLKGTARSKNFWAKKD